MIIEEFPVTLFQQNARIIGCEETRRAVCVDPGAFDARFGEILTDYGLELQAIALTHAHLDHIGGVAEMKRRYPRAEIILHRDDEELYRRLPEQPAIVGVPRAAWRELGLEYETPPPIDRYWDDGETYRVGNLAFEISHCPGHAPGHIVLFERVRSMLLAGDCLFAGSIGRTDLPGGSHEVLLHSIKTRILPLGDDVRVYPGHGENTTIGHERRTNPFLVD